ncbi:predicted protein [Lichtheimia corymbifera JMRC:FSU:9682]|uniref:Uncharacterized protein n=1 Tax=Lichtheimia corymbifera JMRC:FSU:9682 TaxID=1263082 RepID=A0A068S658_9FUNG|nr:predicted protein [Lichtheimia corymbifera JMRC:FSU:9682]
MGCRVCSLPKLSTTRSLYIAAFGLNMLDDGTCGSSNKTLISKQEHCTLSQWEIGAAHTGSDEYQAICRNNGIGNT